MACKPTESVSKVENQDSIRQRYDVEIQFASLEDVKRVPLRLNSLKMELREELAADQNIYLVSIECKPHALKGVLEKLNADKGVVAARERQ